MGIRHVWVAACLVCAACGKKQDASGGGSAADDKPEPKPAAATPTKIEKWETPPVLGAKLGEKTGGDFAKIDPWGGGAAAPGGTLDGSAAHKAGGAPTFADKIDISKLDKPADNTGIELKSLAGTTEKTHGFTVTYNPSKSATHEQYRALFEKNHVFEEVAAGLNKTIRLPASVDINTLDCNTINAFYDPSSNRIIVCYELVDYFLEMFKPNAKTDAELGNAVLGALIFSFFHESGHGLIHILDLPAVGREEDSVDQLATLILIAAGDEGVNMALSGAYWFHLQAEGGHNTPFWDEHAFDGQRFYNILCLIYGSDPRKYASFVSSGNLPKNRAVRCSEEYAKINHAWEKLLGPHLTNGAALNIDYKPKVPVSEAPKKTNEDPWGDPDAPSPASPPPPGPAKSDDDDTPPPRSSITCEDVARKAGELISDEARQRAKDLSEDELEKLNEKLETELPAVVEQILAECAKANWPDTSRKCVMKAKTLAQATKCQ